MAALEGHNISQCPNPGSSYEREVLPTPWAYKLKYVK
jgi:hypothetical protein